ncbi:MAG: hypothetical protein AAGC60_30275 [Acidobacteriota bacterium]
MKFRIELRGFDTERIEEILRFTSERYVDTATGRLIAVGRQDETLLMIPYDLADDEIVPVTVHPTSRGQIKTRLNSGRLRHE